MSLDPRFEQYRSIDPNRCPGGVVARLVDMDGVLVVERELGSAEDAVYFGGLDGCAAAMIPGRAWMYFYDGDTGECMSTVLTNPA